MKKEVKNKKFPKFSKEMKRLKTTEGGASAVCEVMQKYEKKAVEAAISEERTERIKNMIQKGYTKAAILDLNYTEEEYLGAATILGIQQ